MTPRIDRQDAVAIATDRVLQDIALDHLEEHILDVVEEKDGWWVRWGPPEGWLGGGPNVFVSKSDGRVRELYYDQ